MSTVITEAEARKITGGRTPLVPIEYEAAVTALQACVSIDDAKYWSDKADALAAWAKIYRSDEAGRKAAQLKLHAFRRIGQLARELRPLKNRKGFGGGREPGASSLLKEHGFSKSKIEQSFVISRLPAEKFQEIIEAPKVPSPSALTVRPVATEEFRVIYQGLQVLRGACRKIDARKLARMLRSPEEIKSARELSTEVAEWLDIFEHALGAVSATASQEKP